MLKYGTVKIYTNVKTGEVREFLVTEVPDEDWVLDEEAEVKLAEKNMEEYFNDKS